MTWKRIYDILYYASIIPAGVCLWFAINGDAPNSVAAMLILWVMLFLTWAAGYIHRKNK